MLSHRLIILQNFLDIILGQHIKDGGGLVTDLDHTSGGTVIGLHTGEVPSGELLLINDTITIEIEVFEGSLELVLIQWLSKHLRKSLELLCINGSVTILVEL